MNNQHEIAVNTPRMKGTLRVVGQGAKPWFVAKDVAKALGYSDVLLAVRRHCPDTITAHVHTTGGPRPAKLIDEAGFLRLLIQRLPTSAAYAALKQAMKEARVLLEEATVTPVEVETVLQAPEEVAEEAGEEATEEFTPFSGAPTGPAMLPAVMEEVAPPLASPKVYPETAPAVQSPCALGEPMEFVNEALGSRVRVVIRQGAPWFVAKDVALALEFRDAFNAIRGLDEDEKGTQIMSTPGGTQTIAIISESGLYTLALRSTKPEAKAFRRWVTHKVLPSIRVNGVYITTEQVMESRRDPLMVDAMAERIIMDRNHIRALEASLDELRCPDSHYGDISPKTGTRKTLFVKGYFKTAKEEQEAPPWYRRHQRKMMARAQAEATGNI